MIAAATPGPWGIRKEKHTILVCDENGNQIATIRPVRKYGVAGDDMANARLLAASAEMAVALRAILFQTCQGAIFERDACITQARAAYLKSQGEG